MFFTRLIWWRGRQTPTPEQGTEAQLGDVTADDIVDDMTDPRSPNYRPDAPGSQ